jgi:hypothetical protein
MKTFKKIDLYFNGDYLCSTKQSKTCRDAVMGYLLRLSHEVVRNHPKPLCSLVDQRIFKHPKLLKGRFDKGDLK